MKNLTAYLGASGLGFLAAGAFLRFTQPGRDRLWASFLVVGLGLLLVYLVDRRSTIVTFARGRSAREGANAVVFAAAVAGILGYANYLANRHAKRWDLTAARQYTLSDQTTKIVGELDRDVEVVLLDNPGSARALAARDLLRLYDEASSRLTVEVIDPEAEPQREIVYREPGEAGVELGTIVLVSGDRRERATAASEPEITNALLRLLREGRKKIYFVGGHQEKSIDDTDPNVGLSVIKGKLEASTYDVETLVISRSLDPNDDQRLEIPADAAAIVIAGPATDFLPEELDAIDRYLAAGGKAVFLVDPKTQGSTTALVDYLAGKGIVLGDNVVVDAYSLPPVYPVVRSYGRHPIVQSFQNATSIFPLVRTVERADQVPEGIEVRDLFSSEPESWAETRLSELNSRKGPAPDQRTGPLTLAVAATMPVTADASPTADEEKASAKPSAPPKEARVVVVGDSDFIANEIARSPLLNADLFLNMVNWVTQDEDLISIRPREAQDRRLVLSGQQQTNALLFSLFVIPGIILITGISVWWGRRA